MEKDVFFRALPESPIPPPLTPFRATWLFLDVKIQPPCKNVGSTELNWAVVDCTGLYWAVFGCIKYQ